MQNGIHVVVNTAIHLSVLASTATADCTPAKKLAGPSLTTCSQEKQQQPCATNSISQELLPACKPAWLGNLQG
jgi:hypothetical protein